MDVAKPQVLVVNILLDLRLIYLFLIRPTTKTEAVPIDSSNAFFESQDLDFLQVLIS